MKAFSRILTIFLALSLFAMACNLPLQSKSIQPGANPQVGATRDVQPTALVVEGSQALEQPAAGLERLPAYQASLVYSFKGQQSGEPSAWTQEYHLQVSRPVNERLLEFTQTGLEKGGSPYLALDATLGDLHYQVFEASQPCAASYLSDEFEGDYRLPELAEMLPAFRTLLPAGPVETINGVSARPYTPTANGQDLPGEPAIEGQIWLAEEGGYVVRYHVTVTGGPETFDPDTQGAYTWEYNVEALDPALSLLPEGCPLALPELPVMPDASEILRQPTYLSFTTASSPADVLAFYTEALNASGFTTQAGGYNLSNRAAARFEKEKLWVDVFVQAGDVTQVTIQPVNPLTFVANPEPEGISGSPGAEPTPAWEETPSGRVGNSFTLLMGADEPSVFDSYHIEVNQQKPVWVNGQAASENSTLSADVQSANVHFTHTDDGKMTEVYLINDEEFNVENGQILPGLGMNSLIWAFWPLDAINIIGIGSLNSQVDGEETIHGREADRFIIKGTLADDPTGLFASLGFGVKVVDGFAWVDRATGALLKLDAGYEADIRQDGQVVGSGSGHMTIEVSQVGAVRVSLPKP